MTDSPPVNLDMRRSKEARLAADIRRNEIAEFEAVQDMLRTRQKELEAQLLADPADNWREAAVKARYLIGRYAKTCEARDPKMQKLIKRALGDFARLFERDAEAP